ncbi:MAG: hypothetical protein Fur0018_12640 [Anaerolineales bacterium]
MFKKLQSFLAPPTYAHPETHRIARFNTYVLYVLYAIALFAVLASPLGITRAEIVLPIGVALLLTGLVARYLLHHNRVNAGGVLISSVVWLILTYSHVRNGGIHSSSIPVYVLVTIIASLVLGRWGRIVFTLASLAAMVLFAWLEVSGQYTFPPASGSPIGTIFSMFVTLLGANSLIQIAIRDLREAVNALQDNQRRLQESNQDIQASRALLLTRTQELEKYTRDLEARNQEMRALAELAQDIATINDLDEILQTAAHRISERFAFYHVGIFLLNAEGDYAVLQATNSEGGRKMLANQHRLKVGEQGIVGYVAATRKARVAIDVGRDATHFNNPYLPHTRSEIALPMITAGEMLGVLDIQSTQEAAFERENIETLQILASQLAATIQNARLFTENQQSLESLQRTYAEGTRQAWAQFLHTQKVQGYLCNELDIINPTQEGWPPELLQALTEGKTILPDEHTLAAPVQVRGQTIGVVRLRKAQHAPAWSAEEKSLVHNLLEQLGLAIDSARLYTATQRRAERERLTAQIVNRIRASNDPQAILQTAVQELQQALNVSRAQVLLQTEEPQQ